MKEAIENVVCEVERMIGQAKSVALILILATLTLLALVTAIVLAVRG